jgi:hypothetical protein
MTVWKTVVLTVLATVLASTVVDAATLEGTPQEQAACRPDVRKFCHGIKSGASNSVYLSCLQANRKKLSNACLTVLKNHGAIVLD